MPDADRNTHRLVKKQNGVTASNPRVVVSRHAEAVETNLRRVVRGEYHLLPLFVYQFLNYLQEGVPDVNDAAGFSQNVGLKGAHMLYVLQEAMCDTDAAPRTLQEAPTNEPTNEPTNAPLQRRSGRPSRRWLEWCAMVLGAAAGHSQNALLRSVAVVWFVHLTLACLEPHGRWQRWRMGTYVVVACAYLFRGTGIWG